MRRIHGIILSTLLLFFAIPMPGQPQASQIKLRTVVIDPGHGGKDAGCVSRDYKTYEKNVTLDVGKRLAAKIEAMCPDVKVIMTRSDDRFVELENRAQIANKAGADLFISIHVNSVEKGTTANGYSVHCLGQSHKKGTDLYSKNLDLVKRENSVIMLEDNYEANYQGFDPSDPQSSIIFNLMQNAHLENSLAFASDVADAMGTRPIRTNRGISQDPFWVLWRTAMPAVLVEIAFMTNPQDLEVMRSESGRDQIASNLFNAFVAFKSRYDREPVKISAVDLAPETTEPAPSASPDSSSPKEADIPSGPLYGVQVLVSGRPISSSDPYFMGYEPWVLEGEKYNKYYIGVSSTRENAAREYQKIKSTIPDSFVTELPQKSKKIN